MEAVIVVDVVWALSDLERSQPAVLRGRCDFGFIFFYISLAAYVLCIF